MVSRIIIWFGGQKVEVREQELEKYVEDSNFSLLVKDNCNQVSSIYNNGGWWKVSPE